ncbi:MAG: hypothetical protein ABFS34_10395 [Gemmatimonadota bacterium]
MDEAAGPRGEVGSGVEDAPVGSVSPETAPHGLESPTTVPPGIVSFFARDAADRPALLLLKAGDAGAAAAAVDLAAALSREGHRLVLCDMSLQTPELHEVLDVPNDEGMTDLFDFGASLRRVTVRVRDDSVFFAPAGVGVPDPETVAGNPRWDRLLAGAAEAGATLLLYAPVDLPGLPEIAARVRVAVVIGGADDADAIAMALPPNCTLLDRLEPAREAEEQGDDDFASWEDEGGSVITPEEEEEDDDDEVDDEVEEDDDEEDVEAEDVASRGPSKYDLLAAEIAALTGSPEDASPAVSIDDPVEVDDAAEVSAADEVDATAEVDGAFDVVAPAEVDAAVEEGSAAGPPRKLRVGMWVLLVLLAAILVFALIRLLPEAGAEPVGGIGTEGAVVATDEPAVTEAAIPAPPVRGEITPLGYTVAIEAHQDLGTARRRLERLNGGDGEMPFLITPFLLDQVVYYRVMAGPYADSMEAVAVRDILYGDGRKATVGEWDVRPTSFGFLIDEAETAAAARARAAELLDAGIPAYPVPVAPDGATRIYAGAFELREQAPVLADPLAQAGLDPALVRVSGWVATP